MTLQIETVPCLSDNYAFLAHDPETGETAVVDDHGEVVEIVEVLHIGIPFGTMSGIQARLFHKRNDLH